ncbi:MAG TPA: hypothetical protein VGB04_10410 [Allosphingosinicella sp.]
MSSSSGHRGKYDEAGPAGWKHLIPHTIYFYYFRKQSDKTYDNDFYFVHYPDSSINAGQLKNEVKRLAANAATPNPPIPPAIGKFGSHPWRFISWLVIAVDSIELDPAVIQIAHTTPNPSEDNHNFFDGGVDVVHLPGGKKVGYMWVWNHMRDANGNELNGDQTFNFKLDRRPPRIFPPELDENGTNTGPPVAPPPTGGGVIGHGQGRGKEGAGAS